MSVLFLCLMNNVSRRQLSEPDVGRDDCRGLLVGTMALIAVKAFHSASVIFFEKRVERGERTLLGHRPKIRDAHRPINLLAILVTAGNFQTVSNSTESA